jgi:hypothetical protein
MVNPSNIVGIQQTPIELSSVSPPILDMVPSTASSYFNLDFKINSI